MKTFDAYVYRNPLGDCTNNGISNRFDSLKIIVLDRPEEEDEFIKQLNSVRLKEFRTQEILSSDYNYVVLVKRMLWGEKHYYLRPLGEHRHVMAGGNFLYSSDSRFAELTESHYPVPIFDRVEDVK